MNGSYKKNRNDTEMRNTQRQKESISIYFVDIIDFLKYFPSGK